MCGTATADISSANTVGFQTINLVEGKWYMVVPQFVKTGATEGETFNALDVMTFSGLNAGTYSTRDAAAPQIQVHRSTDNGYDKYYYISDARKAGVTGTVTAWAPARAAVDEVTVKKFKGFWFKATGVSDGATITVAGEVRDLSKPITITVGAEGSWQMISNPFPCDLNIENMTVDGLTAGTYSTRDAVAPQMQVHRPSDNGYDKYYYISDARQAGVTGTVTAWAPARAAVVSGKICDAGKGFWFKVPSGSGTVTFTMPSDK